MTCTEVFLRFGILASEKGGEGKNAGAAVLAAMASPSEKGGMLGLEL